MMRDEQDGELVVKGRSLMASAGLAVTVAVIAAGLVVGPFAQGPSGPGGTAAPVDRMTSTGRAVTAAVPPTWDELRTISRPGQSPPSAALAPDGTLSAAYGDSVRATYRRQGVGQVWRSTGSIAPGGFAPAIGSDAAGTVTAVWGTGAGTDAAVVTADRQTDGTWTDPVLLAEAVSPFAISIEVNRAGAAVATWLEAPSSDGAALRAAYRPAGGSWTLTRTLARPRLRPVSTLSPGGTATIAYDGPAGYLTVMRRTPARWLPPVGHPAATSLRLFHADEAQPGTLMAVWETRAGDHLTARFAGGAWRPVARLPGPRGPVSGLQVAAARDGSALVLWGSGSGGDPGEVLGVRRSADGALGPVEILDERGPSCGSLRLVGNDRGDVVAVWMSSSGGGPSEATVQVAYRARNAAAWLPPFDAAEGRGALLCADPALALSADGSAAVAWKAPAGRILVRRTVPTD